MTQNASRHCQVFPGWWNHSQLRTTVSEPCYLGVIDQKQERHLGVVSRADSGTLLCIHWAIICILTQFPGDLYALISLRSLLVQCLKVVILKPGCASKSPWQLMKNTNARQERAWVFVLFFQVPQVIDIDQSKRITALKPQNQKINHFLCWG